MTSKISSFNIMLEDLRHRIWMLALSCLGSFLAFPVVFLLRNRDFIQRVEYNPYSITPDRILPSCYVNFFLHEAAITQGIILFPGAVIVGIFGFRYLYSRRMTDLYHSIPVKRSRLFFLTWLNGLLIWLIPMLLFMGITLLFMLVNLARYGLLDKFALVALAAAKMIPVFLICFLIVYHFCLVCAMLSGNAFNALCSSLILGTAAAAIYGIILMLSLTCFETFRSLSLSLEQIAWASPLVSPIIILADASSFLPLYFIHSTSILVHPAFFRTGCILLLLLNLAIACLLYQKRPSELAEHGINNRFLQVCLRFLTTFAASQLGAMLFIVITGKDAVGWYLFGTLLFGILFYCIMNIIMHMNFKSFLAHKLQLGAMLAFSAAFLLTFTMDLTGYDTRLPSKDLIEKASLSYSRYQDSSCRYLVEEDGSLTYTDTIDWAYQDMDSLYPLLEKLAAKDLQYEYLGSVSVDLTLKNGSTFSRSYLLDEIADVELIRPILESREYLAAFYPASCGLFPLPSVLGISSILDNVGTSTKNQEQMQKIMDAYSSDFLAHSSMEELENGIIVGQLDFTYFPEDEEAYGPRFYLYIRSDYTQTLALLKEYYPEVILDQNELSIVSADINPRLALTVPETEDASLSDSYEETAEAYENIAEAEAVYDYEEEILHITDPDQLERLLPYLMLGDCTYMAFPSLRHYQCIGTVTTTKGDIVSCYVEESDLPLEFLRSAE